MADIRTRPIKTYWYSLGNNWGDIFSEHLMRVVYGIQLKWHSGEESELICTGSILEQIPDGYTGHVLGSGFLFDSTKKNLKNSKVHLLRGEYTARQCGVDAPLGDPGLMAHLLSTPTEKTYRYGITPHIADWNLVPDDPEVLKIDITSGVQNVIDSAMQCESLVSSSLHGLVLADSLGIPNCWVELSGNVYGNGYKFKDYYSVYGENPSPAKSIPEAFSRCTPRITCYVKKTVQDVFDEFAESVSL